MASTDRCLFCRIVRGEIPARKAYEDDDVYAFHDINPQAPTHILVVPRKHIAMLDDIDAENSALIATLMARTTQLARDLKLNADGYRIVANNGAAAGQSVFHIHFHLLGGRAFGWPPG